MKYISSGRFEIIFNIYLADLRASKSKEQLYNHYCVLRGLLSVLDDRDERAVFDDRVDEDYFLTLDSIFGGSR